LVLFLILLGCGVVALHAMRWSNVLEEEVAAKVNDLHWYANELETFGARFRALAENTEDLVFTLDGDALSRR